MMKKITIFIFVAAAYAVNAQSLSQQVIGATGSDFSVGNASLSWTIGEPVISTLAAGNNLLTQGFHQPYISVSSIDNHPEFSVQVFPNPSSEILNLLFEYPDNWNIEIFDVLGRRLEYFRTDHSSQSIINLGEYAAGNYLLRISNGKGSVQSFKIQKIK